MSLFPFMSAELKEAQAESEQKIPVEYEINFETGQLTGRTVKGKDAIKMWIYKVIKTERYRHIIYSWDYGIELEDLIGQGFERSYIESEVQRYIKDALSINDHIKEVKDFNVSFEGSVLTMHFTVVTEFGEVNIDERTKL